MAKPLGVLLFAMTGFGNNAFRVLQQRTDINLKAVFTPGYPENEFPYYESVQLIDEVKATGTPLFEGLSLKEVTTREIIIEFEPDLIVVSTFNIIIPSSIIAIPKLGIINIHPSLLPVYRGANPTFWVIMNGERYAGVTVHFIENEEIDKGRIISSEKLEIGPQDTDGELRRKLSLLSEIVLNRALTAVQTKIITDFPCQDESVASYYPKRDLAFGVINIDDSFEVIDRKIRAMMPYPGVILTHNGKTYSVNKVERANRAEKKCITLDIPDGKVNFFVTRTL